MTQDNLEVISHHIHRSYPHLGRADFVGRGPQGDRNPGSHIKILPFTVGKTTMKELRAINPKLLYVDVLYIWVCICDVWHTDSLRNSLLRTGSPKYKILHLRTTTIIWSISNLLKLYYKWYMCLMPSLHEMKWNHEITDDRLRNPDVPSMQWLSLAWKTMKWIWNQRQRSGSHMYKIKKKSGGKSRNIRSL